MSTENNDKYIAKTWIDDGTQEEFKKSFLESLMNQMQGEGNGFNADKIDGKHYCEIINEIDDKTKDMISSFKIGDVLINRDSIKENGGILSLDFSGVLLNVPGTDNKYKRLPWDPDTKVRSGEPDIYGAFSELNDIVKTKTNNTDFTQYKKDTESYIKDLKNFKDSLKDSVVFNETTQKTELNASSLNGLRIYVRTKDQYDKMKENDDPRILDERNLFIFTEGPISGEILAQQPDTQPISDYYKFSIQTLDETDENGNLIQVTYLMYQHELEDEETWHKICKTEDFIDANVLEQTILNFMKNNSNYELNDQSFLKSLKKVHITDESDYDLGQYIRWSGIRGISCSKYGINELSTNPTKDNVGRYGQPRIADLNAFAEKIEEIIDTKIKEKVLLAYPIGSIYLTLNPDEDPAETFGGKWELLPGRFLLGSGDCITENNLILYSFNAGDTGGEYKHVLDVSEIPSHNHYFEHEHNPGTRKFLYSNADIKAGQNRRKVTEKDKNGYYNVYINQANAWINENPVDINGVKNSKYTNNTGGNQGHYNMPPYLVVNMWKRTG